MKNFYLALFLIFSFTANSQNIIVDTLLNNGSTESRINLVILGDGYQQHEYQKFTDDAENIVTGLFLEKPFDRYINYFNVVSVFTPSNESGAAMDPNNLIDNYFGSTFWYAGIERLLVPTNNSQVVNVLANHFPTYDQVLMIVNSTKYGGSGGWVATASTNVQSLEIMIHEIGHSFAFLADEYWAGDQFAAELSNMTMNNNPATVKWKNWYGDFNVGIFQHCCGGNSSQWYKPHESCKMEVLGVPFCAVCTEAFIERIHVLTNPINSYLPSASFFLASQFPLSFELDLIEPISNSLSIKWELNSLIKPESIDSLSLNEEELIQGINYLTAIVTDTTQLIRIDQYESINLYAVTWVIDFSTTDISEIKSSRNIFSLNFYPNPASETLYFESEIFTDEIFEVVIYDLAGREAMRFKTDFQTSNKLSIDISMLSDSYYLIAIEKQGIPLYSGKLIVQ
ncbi:MAG: T9SS C-terminal target domain-containing protein [Chitinophagaceae bacterium]|nr:MAG: T9SS C-terminal target domain-containing protein [Chitinophagaceae bacterium]